MMWASVVVGQVWQCVCLFVYVFLLSRFLYVNPILPFSTLQRQNLPPGKPHSSLAFSSTAAMVGYFLLM